MSYPKEIRQKCSELLAARRERAISELAARRNKIIKELPEIAVLERELSTTSLKLSRAVLEGGDVTEKIENIKAFNLSKQGEIKSALINAGYAVDALEPQYCCSVCKDTGNDNGNVCRCVYDLQKALMYERLASATNISDSSFENFSLDYYSREPINQNGPSARDIMTKALLQCKKYADEFSLDSESMLLCGKPGLGKTHLSVAIACNAIEKGYNVLYLPFHTFISQLEAARFGSGSEEYKKLLEPVMQSELLLLDDLGSEFSTSFSVAVLYDIVNTRQLLSLPTIINTNLTSSELITRYTERTASRLQGCYSIIPFAGSDIRLKKKSLL